MKKFQIVVLCLVSIILTGCAHGTSLNRISVGMTKAQVIDEIGEPESVAAQNGIEVMRYDFWKDFWQRKPGDWKSEFYVRLVNGRVESYGRMGDFDSTKDPAYDINIRHR